MNKIRKFIALSLFVIMLFGVAPINALAADVDITDDFECPNFLAFVRQIVSKPAPARIFRSDVEEIEFFTLFQVSNAAGIEHFTALREIGVWNSPLTSLDLSNNSALMSVDISDSPLTSLNVSRNTELVQLIARNTQLTSLDLSNNNALMVLNVDGSRLTSLDVSNNTALDFLVASNNQLTSLNVSNNPNLGLLAVSGNRMTSPDDVTGWRSLFNEPTYEYGAFVFFPQQGQTGQQQEPTLPNLAAASAWAHDDIARAIELRLVPQNLQSAFTQPITRAEFAALAVALYEAVTGEEIIGRMEFNDTADINVQKMGYLGVVTGVGGGNFAPNQSLTREQAAVMLARLSSAISQPLPQANPTFADNANISAWAFEAVGQMQASGIMGGVGGNNFSPSGAYTREQSIVTILRLI